jgi:C-terminal peptidase (prc)
MLKRIPLIAAGLATGIALTLGAGRISNAWSLWSSRELNRSVGELKDVLRLVNEHYVEAAEVPYERLTKSALHGMVESLDPYSEFLEPREMEDLEEQLSGNFSGVGIQVEIREGRVLVIAPIANSPAERAGIERGDEILGVDGKGFDQDVTIDDIVDRLRGRPRSKVTMDLLRAREGKRFQVTLQRETIELESVRAVEVLSGKIGYILLSEFSDHTARDFGRAIDRLAREGIESLIIDLRNNPGGLLESAVAVAEPFFERGEEIVSTRGRKPEDTTVYRAQQAAAPRRWRLAVLINGNTASAAEVLTGALKDTGRAVVVGERSFGKGSVQTIFPLGNGGGVRLTTARYFTPSGVSIHETGIAPQVEVALSEDEASKLTVQLARTDVSDPHEFKERFGFEPIEDRQLEAALQVLRGAEMIAARSGVAVGK